MTSTNNNVYFKEQDSTGVLMMTSTNNNACLRKSK
jgi:hypothetical protein